MDSSQGAPTTEANPVRRSSEKKEKTVLIIGDWIVDEHWVIGEERSRTASRRGDAHYHAIHKPSSTVVSLCGAGLVASLLWSDEDQGLQVHGIGLWHRDDEDALRQMLSPENNCGDTPFRVRRSSAKDMSCPRLYLYNIGECIQRLKPETFDGTTRAIRFYNRVGDQVRLTHRVDWELYVPENDKRTSTSNATGSDGADSEQQHTCRGWITDSSWLDKHPQLPSLPFEELDAIIVKDLVKGVVSDETISWLVDKTEKNTRVVWFVSSKAWRPTWMNRLRGKKVRLVVIPQVSAQEAQRQGAITAWSVAGGRPSYTALRLVDKVDEDLGPDHNRLIVALPEGMTVIAKSCQMDPVQQLIVHPTKKLHNFAGGVPMASVFFSALAARILQEPNRKHASTLHSALLFTDNAMVYEDKRIHDPLGWEPIRQNIFSEDHERSRPDTFPKLRRQDWAVVRHAWKEAREKNGIIDGRRIELWRAMTDIDGYVCCVKTKRDVLKKIKRQLAQFKHTSEAKHSSIMILANPGAGKSFLVQRVAEQTGFHLLLFNITQMISKRDLLDCYDTIVSTRLQLRKERPLLVFFDEINAQLDNSSVYDMFLAPLADGTYTKEGKTFHIPPCVWLFAGTALDTANKTEKGSDFSDRLSLEPLEFRAKDDTPVEEIELELSYLATSLVLARFPDVRFITKEMLEVFAHLNPMLSVRTIDALIGAFEVVRQTVRLSSIPDRELFEKYLAQGRSNVLRGDDGKSISIWTSPDESFGVSDEEKGAI